MRRHFIQPSPRLIHSKTGALTLCLSVVMILTLLVDLIPIPMNGKVDFIMRYLVVYLKVNNCLGDGQQVMYLIMNVLTYIGGFPHILGCNLFLLIGQTFSLKMFGDNQNILNILVIQATI